MNLTRTNGGQINAGAIQNATHVYAEDAEASDAYAIVMSPVITAYTAGQKFTFKANTANTGASTLNVDSIGAKTLKKNHDKDTATGDIEAGSIVTVVYDDTVFQITSISALPSAGISDLIDDTTPQLGGELDAGANSIGFTMQTATGDGATTVDWGNGNHLDFTFGAFNETFTFTAPAKAGVYTMSLKQDSVGSRTATFPATVKWAGGGTAPTLTTTATTGYDIISFRFDGTNYHAVPSLDFS